MADAVEHVVKIGGLKSIDRAKADLALAEFSAGDDFGWQFVILAEEQALADADFAAGTNQAFPVVGLI